MFFLAQPTWGVDVGASAVLRQALLDLSRNGVGIVLISEELEELFEISDRIAVLAQGRLSAAQPRGATSAESVGMMMSGLFDEADVSAAANASRSAEASHALA